MAFDNTYDIQSITRKLIFIRMTLKFKKEKK